MSDIKPLRPFRRISVLIVDDHPLFRDGLQQALSLEDDMIVVGASEDGESAIRAARHMQPQVILLDINLPGMNGLQVMRQLKAERQQSAIIIITAYHDNEQVLHAMKSGAAAYCAKDIQPDALIQLIRDVAQGWFVVNQERMTSQQVAEWIQAKVEKLGNHYALDSEEHYVPLSPREMEILQMVTNGLSNKEIAAALRISQQTVKNHMTAILKKMSVEDRTQAAVIALRRGWVRPNAAPPINKLLK